MGEGVGRSERPERVRELTAENTYRVKPADSDTGRNSQEHFRDELKKKKEEEEAKPAGSDQAPPSESAEAPRRRLDEIHDDVILTSVPSVAAPDKEAERGKLPPPGPARDADQAADVGRPPSPPTPRVNIVA